MHSARRSREHDTCVYGKSTMKHGTVIEINRGFYGNGPWTVQKWSGSVTDGQQAQVRGPARSPRINREKCEGKVSWATFATIHLPHLLSNLSNSARSPAAARLFVNALLCAWSALQITFAIGNQAGSLILDGNNVRTSHCYARRNVIKHEFSLEKIQVSISSTWRSEGKKRAKHLMRDE